VARSADWGYSWQRNALPLNPYSFGTPHDLAATTGALHMVRVGTPGQESYYTRLLFGDSAWSYPIPISDDLNEDSFLPRIVAWGDSDVLVAWVDYLYSPYPWTGDILCRRSTDNGASWLPVVQVTQSHLTLEKALCVRGDSVFLVYDEIVLDGETNTEEVFFNFSSDGGLSWGEPVRLTTSPWRSIYPDIAMSGERLHVVYCDARDDTAWGNHNRLFYRRGILRGPQGVTDGWPENHAIGLTAYPNPFNAAVTITVDGIDKCAVEVFDITGRRVAELQARNGQATWDPELLSSGVYLARLEQPHESQAIRLIYLK
jgi:hypothetical protein